MVRRMKSGRVWQAAWRIVVVAVLFTACVDRQASPPPSVATDEPTAIPPSATLEPTATPTLAPVEASPTIVTRAYDGHLEIVAGGEEGADPVQAAADYGIEDLKAWLAGYAFSRDVTLELKVDSEGRGYLELAEDEETETESEGLWVKYSYDNEKGETAEIEHEVNGDGIRFFPYKGGNVVLMTEAGKDGSVSSWDISAESGRRGGNKIVAYTVVDRDDNGLWYKITHRVNPKTGMWEELENPEILRASETIFGAEAMVEAEPELERVFLDPMEALAGELKKYDFDKPVFRAVSSTGVELIIPFNTEAYPVRYTIGLKDDPNNTELADLFLTELWPKLQVAYNNAGRTPQEIASDPVDPSMMAVDADLAFNYTGRTDRVNPLSGNPPLLQKIPMTMGDVSRVIFLAGKTSRKGNSVPEADHQVTLSVPTESGNQEVTVINMYAPITSGGNATYTILAFTDQSKPDKRVLVFLEEAQEPQTDQIMAYNLLRRLLDAPYRAFIPQTYTEDLISKALGGNGNSPEFNNMELDVLHSTIIPENRNVLREKLGLTGE